MNDKKKPVYEMACFGEWCNVLAKKPRNATSPNFKPGVPLGIGKECPDCKSIMRPIRKDKRVNHIATATISKKKKGYGVGESPGANLIDREN